MSPADPLWYKDAVFYEVYVRGFFDSNGDGNGDLRGLTEKLDYLKELGVDCLWLLPLYPSPLKDDGYDIADFRQINPQLGTLEDFEALTRAAHERGLRILMDLVINHTSDQHPWFQEARRDPTSPRHDYYVWSDSDRKFPGARIIFKDTETSNWSWDPVARMYYWHRFFAHQPDLNYDNPAVAREILQIMAFWLDRGIDGFRVDAVPYLIEREEPTVRTCRKPMLFASKCALRGYPLSRHVPACRSQSMAQGFGSLFRRRRRISHGVQFPPHAALVHRPAARTSLAHH